MSRPEDFKRASVRPEPFGSELKAELLTAEGSRTPRRRVGRMGAPLEEARRGTLYVELVPLSSLGDAKRILARLT